MRVRLGPGADVLVLASCRIGRYSARSTPSRPRGMWLTTRPSGSPLCSCTTTRPVKSLLLHSSTRSGSTCARVDPPAALISGFTSLTNCVRRDDGSRDVVTKTLGSRSFARAYSSSRARAVRRGRRVLQRNLAPPARFSVPELGGDARPSSRHCRALLLVQLPLLALQGLAVDELAPQARGAADHRGSYRPRAHRRRELAGDNPESRSARSPARASQWRGAIAIESRGGGRTFTENEEGTSARFHIEKKSARLESVFDKCDAGRSSRWLSTNQSVGNLSEIEAIQPRASGACSRKLVCHRAFFRPHISTRLTFDALKHRKDGLPLRHRALVAQRAAVRTNKRCVRVSDGKPRRGVPMRHDAMPTPAHRREPRLRRRAGGAGTRPTRGEDAADARQKFARAACLPRDSLGPALARARRTVDRSRACSPPAMRMRSFPPKPIDAGESLPSVPRAIADPPLSPSAHQHLRDVLRREARLRREGREGRQGRHRRPRRVRGGLASVR